jgi:YidC/Oxa1 family membrane protein insertase
MQQKNLLLFLVLMLVIFVGWQHLTLKLYPPKHKADAKRSGAAATAAANDLWPWKNLPAPAQAEKFARLILAGPPGTLGLGDAYPVDLALALTDRKDLSPPAVAAKPPPPKPPAAPIVEEKVEKVQQFTLGDDSSFLKVVLTNKGAAVRQVVLNEFQKANDLGQPVWEDGNKPAPLDLIPDDPHQPTPPSFRLYNYADAAKDDHPLDTLGKRVWQVVEPKHVAPGDVVQRVTFRTTVPEQGVEVFKTFSLEPKTYHVNLEVRVKNLRPEKQAFRYQLEGPHGLPVEGVWYTSTYRNALVGWADKGSDFLRHLDDLSRIVHRAGGDSVPESGAADENVLLRYAGVAVQYFASVIVVDNDQPGPARDMNFLQRARATLETEPPNLKQPYRDDITVRMVTKAIDLPASGEVVHKYLLYNGPVKVRLLGQLEGAKAVDPALVHRYETTLHLNTLTDYHSETGIGRIFSTIGWTNLLIICTNVMHWLLWHLHWVIGNYGLCIIFLTVMVRGLMFPVSRKQALTSIKMQALAPEMKKIQEKYKDDPQAKTKAVWELYGKHGVNPMGSCLPVLLQMPIFLGLYYALQESIHFRLARFLWMPNLAAPDMLIEWGNNIPILSDYLGPFFNLLPIVAVSLMLVQQKMITPPAMDEQQEMQQKMMKYMMVFMGFMFYKVAAGLCIYFIASSLWGLTERKLLPKPKSVTPGGAPAVGGSGGARNGPVGPKGPPRSKARAPQNNGGPLVEKVKSWWAEVLREARKK